ncbi:hypothetical protein BZB76_4106 [Actinomadura pelletieri DSM 43383]|uniref:Uncharacterized protein n=1 Tax=Actinomadura pelletieri DSM 43383 TaxID=1120940 RepID=A0A495QLN5_9ACTN|nr:hypothetical protein [Actinomadura pelletieri]RKS73416.1 hypothetical protein BZB76_4106 [Actinomadura pelletieri DSM 43383]
MLAVNRPVGTAFCGRRPLVEARTYRKAAARVLPSLPLPVAVAALDADPAHPIMGQGVSVSRRR